MDYTIHTWTSGETVTAEKLNNIENGIKEINSKNLIVQCLYTNYDETSSEFFAYFDTTLNDIINAFTSGKNVIFNINNGSPILIELYYNSEDQYYELTIGSSIFQSESNINLLNKFKAKRY